MSDPILITPGSPEEFEDFRRIKVEEGVELHPHSKGTTEHIERVCSSPVTMIDTPLPWLAWKGIADIIARQIRSTQSAALRESRSWAWKFCMLHYKNRNDGLRPAFEQMQFMDMLRATDPHGRVDREATRCLSEAIYRFMHNEYLGRKVG